MHKKIYSFLVFSAEFKSKCSSPLSTQYVDETASDLLLSLFLWIQGVYKSSKAELRCAIENILKSLLVQSNSNIINEKSVYRIFELAEGDKHFDDTYSLGLLTKLHDDYAKLCSSTHSALSTLSPVEALKILPKYDSVASHEHVDIFFRVTENILSILYYRYAVVVDEMHPENKQDFLEGLSKTAKKDVQEQLFG